MLQELQLSWGCLDRYFERRKMSVFKKSILNPTPAKRLWLAASEQLKCGRVHLKSPTTIATPTPTWNSLGVWQRGGSSRQSSSGRTSGVLGEHVPWIACAWRQACLLWDVLEQRTERLLLWFEPSQWKPNRGAPGPSVPLSWNGSEAVFQVQFSEGSRLSHSPATACIAVDAGSDILILYLCQETATENEKFILQEDGSLFHVQFLLDTKGS